MKHVYFVSVAVHLSAIKFLPVFADLSVMALFPTLVISAAAFMVKAFPDGL